MQPKDIAILVRSNSQAPIYQQALNAAGIPAILNSKQSVFASPQALEIYTRTASRRPTRPYPALKTGLDAQLV